MDTQAPLFTKRRIRNRDHFMNEIDNEIKADSKETPREKNPRKILGGIKAWRRRTVRKKQSLTMQIGYLVVLVMSGILSFDPVFRSGYAAQFAFVLVGIGLVYLWQEHKLLD